MMVALLVMPSIQNAGGYRAVFFVNAGLGLVVGVAAAGQKAVRAVPRHPEGTTTFRGLGVSLRTCIGNPRVLLLGLANVAGLAIGVGVLAWTPSFLQDVHGSAGDGLRLLGRRSGCRRARGQSFGGGCRSPVG